VSADFPREHSQAQNEDKNAQRFLSDILRLVVTLQTLFDDLKLTRGRSSFSEVLRASLVFFSTLRRITSRVLVLPSPTCLKFYARKMRGHDRFFMIGFRDWFRGFSELSEKFFQRRRVDRAPQVRNKNDIPPDRPQQMEGERGNVLKISGVRFAV